MAPRCVCYFRSWTFWLSHTVLMRKYLPLCHSDYMWTRVNICEYTNNSSWIRVQWYKHTHLQVPSLLDSNYEPQKSLIHLGLPHSQHPQTMHADRRIDLWEKQTAWEHRTYLCWTLDLPCGWAAINEHYSTVIERSTDSKVWRKIIEVSSIYLSSLHW